MARWSFAGGCSVSRRKADDDSDDPEWAWHFGHFMQGSITELRTREKGDTRFEKRSHYDGSGKLGFDLTPRKKRKRK
jgi:hypothetical protein